MKKRHNDLTSSNSGTDASSDIVNQQPTGGDGGHILGEARESAKTQASTSVRQLTFMLGR